MGLKEDWQDWKKRAIDLEDCPESEMEQLRLEIYAEMKASEEKKAYWEWRIAEEAAHSRILWAMGNGITERVALAAEADRIERERKAA